jgi:hypothetical protein
MEKICTSQTISWTAAMLDIFQCAKRLLVVSIIYLAFLLLNHYTSFAEPLFATVTAYLRPLARSSTPAANPPSVNVVQKAVMRKDDEAVMTTSTSSSIVGEQSETASTSGSETSSANTEEW